MAETRPVRWYAIRLLIGVAVALVVAEAGARVAEANGPPALRWYDTATQLKVEQMEDLGVDVVFAGTSMAWQAFDPTIYTAETGRSAFNAGLAGGVPTVMEPWLLEEVIPRVSPETVVWGMSSLDFSTAFGSENAERYNDALETRDGTLAAIERAAGASALVRYRAILRSPDDLVGDGRDEILEDFSSAAATLGPAGVRQDFTIDTSDRRGAVIAARLAGYALDPDDLASVITTVEAMQSAGIEVVFAELPLPARTTPLHPNGLADLGRAHAAIDALATDLGVDVIDLRGGFSDDDFVDFTHLGPGAVGRITRTLATALDDKTPSAAVDVPDLETITRLAARVGQLNDAVFGLITDRRAASSSEFWYLSQHYGRYRDLVLESRAGDESDVVMVGSSLMVSGGVPSLFAEVDGRSAFNIALASTEPVMLDEWTRDVVALANPETVVFGISAWLFRDRDPTTETCDRVEGWVRAAELRPLIFSGAPGGPAGLPPEELLFGSGGNDALPFVGPLPRVYDFAFTADGERSSWPILSEPALARSYDLLLPQAESYRVCDDMVETFLGTVEWLTAGGIDVLVVGMPVSEFQVTAFPGGWDQLETALGPIASASLESGAVGYLDLTHELTEDQFRDLRHATREGADIVTRRIAAELARLGS